MSEGGRRRGAGEEAPRSVGGWLWVIVGVLVVGAVWMMYRSTQASACGEGMALVDGECRPMCGEGTRFAGGQCVMACEAGMALVDGECRSMCGEGTRFTGGQCVVIDPGGAAVGAKSGEAVERPAAPTVVEPPEGYALIPAGRFMMGSPASEEERDTDEGPQHEVEITRAFWMKTVPVTTGEWFAVVGNRPSGFAKNCGDDCPVEKANWYEALAYANRLSEREGLEQCYALKGCAGKLGYGASYDEVYQCRRVKWEKSCTGYRLPTESEWEYAYRAGTEGAYYGPVEEIAWYDGNTGDSTQPVGKKKANAWGLYDMAGNVLEWTWSRYGGSQGYRTGSTHEEPYDNRRGAIRVLRGGSWCGFAPRARAAARHIYDPLSRNPCLGFRLVRTVP